MAIKYVMMFLLAVGILFSMTPEPAAAEQYRFNFRQCLDQHFAGNPGATSESAYAACYGQLVESGDYGPFNNGKRIDLGDVGMFGESYPDRERYAFEKAFEHYGVSNYCLGLFGPMARTDDFLRQNPDANEKCVANWSAIVSGKSYSEYRDIASQVVAACDIQHTHGERRVYSADGFDNRDIPTGVPDSHLTNRANVDENESLHPFFKRSFFAFDTDGGNKVDRWETIGADPLHFYNISPNLSSEFQEAYVTKVREEQGWAACLGRALNVVLTGCPSVMTLQDFANLPENVKNQPPYFLHKEFLDAANPQDIASTGNMNYVNFVRLNGDCDALASQLDGLSNDNVQEVRGGDGTLANGISGNAAQASGGSGPVGAECKGQQTTQHECTMNLYSDEDDLFNGNANSLYGY